MVTLGAWVDRWTRSRIEQEVDAQGALARQWERLAQERESIAEQRRAVLEREHAMMAVHHQAFEWLREVVTINANVPAGSDVTLPQPPEVPEEFRAEMEKLVLVVVPLFARALARARSERNAAVAVESSYRSLLNSVRRVTHEWQAMAERIPNWDWPQAILGEGEYGDSRGLFTAQLLPRGGERSTLDSEVMQLLIALRTCEEAMQMALSDVEASRQAYADRLISAMGSWISGEPGGVLKPAPERLRSVLGPLNDVGYVLSMLLREVRRVKRRSGRRVTDREHLA